MRRIATSALIALPGVMVALGASVAAGSDVMLKPGNEFRDCDKDCPEMIVLPAGDFVMGSPEGMGGKQERPAHKITIAKPFAVSKFEVTFDEWDACVTGGGCRHRADDRTWGRGRQPVINISWHDAKEYTAWLTNKTGLPYRLLSEAEWEYAARAGTTTRFFFGDEEAALSDFGWSTYNSELKAHPVGQKKPNGFGLYDVHGNAAEWRIPGTTTTLERRQTVPFGSKAEMRAAASFAVVHGTPKPTGSARPSAGEVSPTAAPISAASV